MLRISIAFGANFHNKLFCQFSSVQFSVVQWKVFAFINISNVNKILGKIVAYVKNLNQNFCVFSYQKHINKCYVIPLLVL